MFGSSVPHGWNTGVLNAPTELIQRFLNESFTARFNYVPNEALLDILWATSVSMYLVGGCAGAFSAGWFADAFGRKKSILFCHVFGVTAAVLYILCKMMMSFEMLILARLIVGFGCGAGTGLVPMYLTEISPINMRGSMGVLHQLGLTIGIFLSQLFGLRELLGTEDRWHYLLAGTVLPCIVSIAILPWSPESPRYLLVNKGDEYEAERALKRFRGVSSVSHDLAEMQHEVQQQKLDPEWSFMKLLKTKSLRRPLIMVCFLAMSQQLSGINVIFYYSTSVFRQAGIPGDKIQLAVLGTGAINVCFTAFSVPLMEKTGRRPLLLYGMVGMVISAVTITVAFNLQDRVPWMSYLSLACVIGFIFGFSIGLGSVPQFIGAELFRQGPRPPAMSIAGFLNWLCNFAVGISFPIMDRLLGVYTFLPFIVSVSAFGVFTWWQLPETKNRTINELYRILRIADTHENVRDEKLSMLGNRLAHQTPPKAEMEALLRKGGSVASAQKGNKSRRTTTDV
ncbi:Solute carrier family 2, facilitated glucose transporter member 3 [Lamellibrachia satsuma]|nr:Solute carrier family 2, facilitated glucose transporter member 3 [Lamellibrachia satsuma]